MNDHFIELCRYSVGKYWKRCGLASCLELGFTNTCVLPGALFAEGALHVGCL